MCDIVAFPCGESRELGYYLQPFMTSDLCCYSLDRGPGVRYTVGNLGVGVLGQRVATH